jgi:hypothetical protein
MSSNEQPTHMLYRAVDTALRIANPALPFVDIPGVRFELGVQITDVWASNKIVILRSI